MRLFGERVFPVCTPGASDSATFDEVLELLAQGWEQLADGGITPAELDLMARKGLTDLEFEDIRRQVKGQIMLSLESLAALAVAWAAYHRIGRTRLGAPLDRPGVDRHAEAGASRDRHMAALEGDLDNVVSGKVWLFARDAIGTATNWLLTSTGLLQGKSTTASVYIKNTGEGPLQLVPFAVPSGITVAPVSLDGNGQGTISMLFSRGWVRTSRPAVKSVPPTGATSRRVSVRNPSPAVQVNVQRP